MANLIANTNGSMSGTSFGTCETATGAFNFPSSGQTSIGNGAGTVTTKQYGPAFSTTNGNVCDGVLLLCSYLTGTGGTLTVYLNNGTSDVASVTVNAADIASVFPTASLVFFKFPSPVTLNGTSTWKIGFQSSVNDSVSIVTTQPGWFPYHALRLTATATPASNDHIYIAGELTGAGTNNPRTITMNYTSNSIAPGQVEIGALGTLAYGGSASTNYYLRLNGYLFVWSNGQFSMGQIGFDGYPIPSNSTAILEFNCASNVQYGLEVLAGGTFTTWGSPTKYTYTHLNGDAAANATSLTTADDTSSTWAVGDTLAFAPTGLTYTESETANIASISGTTITLTSGLLHAHTGTIYPGSGTTTFDMRGEIINLTRNVKIRGISGTNQAYVNINGTAIVNCLNTEFYWLGSGTGFRRGIDIGTTTGSSNFNGCSQHDYLVASSIGLNVNTANANNFSLMNNVSYNCNFNHIATASINSANTNWTISNCVGIYSPSGGAYIFFINGLQGAVYNLTTAGSTIYGMILNGAATGVSQTVSNLVSHSCNSYGMFIENLMGGEITGARGWHCQTAGLILENDVDALLDSFQFFANNGFGCLPADGCFNVTCNNWTTDNKGYSSDPIVQTYGVAIGGGGAAQALVMNFTNCNYGQSWPQTSSFYGRTTGCNICNYNCNSADSQLVVAQNVIGVTSRIGFQRLNNINGNHLSYYKYGMISIDTTIAVVPPSERLTPNGGAGNKLQSGVFSCGVANGSTVAPSIQVRCSLGSDGAAYNGNPPNLLVKTNYAVGINSDTVLSTVPNSYLPGGSNQGQWYTLTGVSPAITDDAVLSFVVDCDGTTGWINIDTPEVSA